MLKLRKILEKFKYSDISEIFNILDVKNSCIVTKDKSVFIYEVAPVTLINVKKDVKERIVSKYIEMLKELNIDFQILVRNNKINIERYLKKYEIFKMQEDNNYCNLVKEYQESLKEEFLNEKIFLTSYYIIISLNEKEKKIYLINNILMKLNEIGCNVEQIVDKDKLKKLMYECINKEQII